MDPRLRPPINTPVGCFLSNTVGSMFFLFAAILGAVVGGQVNGEQGASAGFVVMGFLSLFTPWRRWVVGWYQEWELARRPRPPDEGPE